MPQASAGYVAQVKYAWMDHDPAYIDISPPVQNTWYELYHAYDVRQLLMGVKYRDDEQEGNNVEVRWTCDGNVYLFATTLDDDDQEDIYKTKFQSGTTEELTRDSTPPGMDAPYRDKRALDFLVEARVTGVIGTNAHLEAYALYETLEAT